MGNDQDVRWLEGDEMAAWRGFLAAHGRLLRVLDEELLADHGISMSDHEVLIRLSETDGGRLRMAELADDLILSRSGLTRRIDGLVKDGLVRRTTCDADRRGVWAELTEAGWARVEEVTPSHIRSVRAHFVDVLDAEELAVIARAVAKVAGGEDGWPANGSCGQPT